MWTAMLGTVVLATGAFAQGDDRSAKMLAALDRDKNGDVSLEEYVAPIKSRVALMDKNKDGQANAAEIGVAFKKGETDPGVVKFLQRFDLNKDGGVTVTEAEEYRAQRFDVLDANDDGKLAVDELAAGAGRTADKSDKSKPSSQ